MRKVTAKRSALLVGAAVSAIALGLTGCTAAAPSSSATAAKLSTLTIMAPYLTTQAPAQTNPIGTALDKAIGTNLNITWVPNSSYEDKTNITLAGSNVPQVMVIQSKDSGFVNTAEAGGFWNLTNYLKDYPNLDTTEPQVQQASSINGQVYGIFRARDVMRTAVIVRKDWLQKLGLQMPKTTADLLKVAKAFTNDDPNGDGKKDTWGIEIPKWPGGFATNSPYDAIETWYGAGNDWYKKGSSLEPSFTSSKWIDALNFEKQLVEGGYVNPDYATLDSVDWNQAFLNGKAGIIIDTYSRARQIESLLEKQDPNSYQGMVGVTGNLIGPDGTMHALPTPGYSGFLAIPKSSVKTVAQLKAVLSVLNKMNSKQAQIIMNNGLAGQNFTVKNNLAEPITSAAATNLQTITASYAQLGTNVTGNKFYLPAQPNAYDQQMYDSELKTAAADTKHAVYNPAAAYVSKTYTQQGATLDNIIVDARLKYISGQENLQQLKAAIQQWKASGGSQVISETNALYKKDK
ncbi:extracellular solute-binding protein [Curtobacterium ammoniigenes]|uniref:extracellular solute-binding protein n=1 Tax=Curtobacterium ammoniigenes TaxID=395387 RepID=UPI00082B4AF2|nr:extracellular solute-binding protein [Curtobacterium ammoniigenes]